MLNFCGFIQVCVFTTNHHLKNNKIHLLAMLAIFETLLSSRDCYRLVTSVLGVADIFSVFTAKIRHRLSENIGRMHPQDFLKLGHTFKINKRDTFRC